MRGPASIPIAVVAGLAFLLPLRALMHAAGPAMEEGMMLVFPERVLHGAIPNKDFLYLYAPGSLWVLAAAYALFGVNIVVERLVGLVQLVGLALGVAGLVRWWGRGAAVAAVTTSVLFAVPALQLIAIPWTGAVALGLAALNVLLRARHDVVAGDATGAGGRWALAGGVLAGFATLYRADLALAVVLGGAAALWGLPRPVVRRALLGFGIGLAPWLVHVGLAGPGVVWRGVLVDPMLHLRAARRLPVPPDPNHLEGVARIIMLVDRSWPVPRLSPPRQLFVWFFVLAAVTATAVAAGLWAVRRAPEAFRPRVLLAGALFGVGIFPQALQRADSAHFAWVSAVVVALLPAAVAEAATVRRPGRSSARAALVAGIAVVLATAFLLPTYTVARYVALVHDSFEPPRTIAIRNDGRTFYVGSDAAFARSIEMLLAAVGRVATAGSRVIVGNSDMRRVPYVDSFLYHLLPRLEPGTFAIEFEPGLVNRPGTPLTAEMRRADVFIASDRWLGWDEPNASMEPGDPGPAEVLRRDFCANGDFGNGYKLYLRCAPSRRDAAG